MIDCGANGDNAYDNDYDHFLLKHLMLSAICNGLVDTAGNDPEGPTVRFLSLNGLF